MARPTKTLTTTQIAEVETLAAVLTTGQIADYFGIGRTTFFSLMERNPEIAERYKRGKAKAIGAIAQGLIAKARGGDTTSMIFFLKTQAGWRETATIEHNVPVETAAVVGDGMRKLTDMLDRIDARKRQMLIDVTDAKTADRGQTSSTSRQTPIEP